MHPFQSSDVWASDCKLESKQLHVCWLSQHQSALCSTNINLWPLCSTRTVYLTLSDTFSLSTLLPHVSPSHSASLFIHNQLTVQLTCQLVWHMAYILAHICVCRNWQRSESDPCSSQHVHHYSKVLPKRPSAYIQTSSLRFSMEELLQTSAGSAYKKHN